jgi:hypothetical protein
MQAEAEAAYRVRQQRRLIAARRLSGQTLNPAANVQTPTIATLNN